MTPTRVPVRKGLQRRAQHLIDSDAYRGNHGFKGEALAAWRYQRRTLLAVLRVVARGLSSTPEEHHGVHAAPCPRSYSLDVGTRTGERWVDKAVVTVCASLL